MTAEPEPAPVTLLNDLAAVAERLHLGRSTVFALLNSGELFSVKIGRKRLVPEAALIQFVEKRMAAATQPNGRPHSAAPGID